MAVTPAEITMGTEVTVEEFPTYTWKIDPVTKRISGNTDGLDAMAQAVGIILNTRRYQWQIYTPYSGHQMEVIGQSYDTARVGLQAQITEALTQDDRITSVDNFQFSASKNSMAVSFTVQTVFGSLNAEVIL